MTTIFFSHLSFVAVFAGSGMGKNPIPDPQHWLTFFPYFTHSPFPHGGEEENAGLNLLALPAGGERGVVQVLDAVPRLLLGYVALRRGLALHNSKKKMCQDNPFGMINISDVDPDPDTYPEQGWH
jgi:hypothetical protein